MVTMMNGFTIRKFLLSIILHTCLVKTLIASSRLEKFKDFEATTLLIHGENIYVGGKNQILKLDTDLNILRRQVNGKVLNSMYCHPVTLSTLGCDPSLSVNKTKSRAEDNINKVLLYSEKPIPMIIACGSVYQGICQFLDVNTLKNISEIYPTYSTNIISSDAFVSSNGPDTSATALISYTEFDGAYLINAKTVTMKSISLVSAISAIHLGDELPTETFLVSSGRINYEDSSFYKDLTAKYQVDYKSSFQIEDQIYFTTNQEDYSSTEKLRYLSKIIQVTLEDGKVFEDYIEFPLACQQTSHNYNRIISSTLLKVNISKEILSNVKIGDFVLFGIFGSDSSPGKYGLCAFLLNDLKKEVSAIKKQCDSKTKLPLVPWSTYKESSCSVSSLM